MFSHIKQIGLILYLSIVPALCFGQSVLIDEDRERALQAEYPVEEKFLLVLLNEKSKSETSSIRSSVKSEKAETMFESDFRELSNYPLFIEPVISFLGNPREIERNEKLKLMTIAPINTLALKMLVAGLQSDDKRVQEQALISLYAEKDMYANYRDYSEEIVKGILKMGFSDRRSMKYWILGLLDIPEGLKAEMLNKAPDPVKARLGDRKAEDRVIEKFLSASNRKKPGHSEELLYIGSKRTIEVFLRGLEKFGMNVSLYIGNGNPATVAYRMLGVYQEYDKATIFREANGMIYTAEKEFQEDKYQSVIRRIEVYFHEKYGVSIELDIPYWVGGPSPEVRETIYKGEW